MLQTIRNCSGGDKWNVSYISAGFKEVLLKHCDYIASSLEVVGIKWVK